MACAFSVFSVEKATFGSLYSENASSLMPTMSLLLFFAAFAAGDAPAADTARLATATMAVAISAMRLDTQ